MLKSFIIRVFAPCTKAKRLEIVEPCTQQERKKGPSAQPHSNSSLVSAKSFSSNCNSPDDFVRLSMKSFLRSDSIVNQAKFKLSLKNLRLLNLTSQRGPRFQKRQHAHIVIAKLFQNLSGHFSHMWRPRGIAFLLQLVQLLGTNQPLFAPIQPVFAQLFIIPFNMFVDSLLKLQRHTRPLYEWMLGVHCFVHNRFHVQGKPKATSSGLQLSTFLFLLLSPS